MRKSDYMAMIVFGLATFWIGSLIEYQYGMFSSFYEKDYQIRSISESSGGEEIQEDMFNPRQEYWNSIPLQHQKLVVQIIGKDIKVKDIGLSGNIAYTGSMRPAIYGGNRVLEIPYKHTGQEQEGSCPDLKAGQIISFKNKYNEDGVQTMHRIINNEIGNGQLQTRGDAYQDYQGEFVACEDIVSIVMGVLYT